MDGQFVPDWLFTNKILENDVAFSNDDIDLRDIDSGIVTFLSVEIGVITMDFNNINLDDDNFNEDDLETIIHVRLMAWSNRYNQERQVKK